jgi:hypothetical protein
MRSVPSAPLVGPFADRLLRLDLPRLDDDRRAEVISFAARRIDGLPSVMHLGVLLLAAVFRVVVALPGSTALVSLLARAPLPLIGEYVRLIRSLGYAYVWETWPDTRPDGGRP